MLQENWNNPNEPRVGSRRSARKRNWVDKERSVIRHRLLLEPTLARRRAKKRQEDQSKNTAKPDEKSAVDTNPESVTPKSKGSVGPNNRKNTLSALTRLAIAATPDTISSREAATPDTTSSCEAPIANPSAAIATAIPDTISSQGTPSSTANTASSRPQIQQIEGGHPPKVKRRQKSKNKSPPVITILDEEGTAIATPDTISSHRTPSSTANTASSRPQIQQIEGGHPPKAKRRRKSKNKSPLVITILDEDENATSNRNTALATSTVPTAIAQPTIPTVSPRSLPTSSILSTQRLVSPTTVGLRTPCTNEIQRLLSRRLLLEQSASTLKLLHGRERAIQLMQRSTDVSSIIASCRLVKEFHAGSLMNPTTRVLLEEAEGRGMLWLSKLMASSFTKPLVLGGLGFPPTKAKLIADEIVVILSDMIGKIEVSYETLVRMGILARDALEIAPYLRVIGTAIQEKSTAFRQDIIFQADPTFGLPLRPSYPSISSGVATTYGFQ